MTWSWTDASCLLYKDTQQIVIATAYTTVTAFHVRQQIDRLRIRTRVKSTCTASQKKVLVRGNYLRHDVTTDSQDGSKSRWKQ